ncbi:hypothetical protein BDF20DRAFT_814305 [Mycotypha africana]|uniref:uncharacterized protein n=1 Tax=Mycotypha africana TaxID=64632 RepID=UPI0023010F42|nr:uncharacterized protein BDF20DRAFT_814305 [Mycotypha africana]KAI8988567.1 hypothetical protein BDF20DRAFT_814305 [Mycotypha africana]
MSNPFISKDAELHVLTRTEEENCYKDMKAKALEACELPIKDFVECSKEHNVTVMWTCRKKLKAMNSCLNQSRTSQEVLDKLLLKKLEEKRRTMKQQ